MTERSLQSINIKIKIKSLTHSRASNAEMDHSCAMWNQGEQIKILDNRWIVIPHSSLFIFSNFRPNSQGISIRYDLLSPKLLR